jgi:hypothetical protein
MNLTGSLVLDGVSNSYFYGMNITSADGRGGISIASSHGIILDTCSSTNNAAEGLNVSWGSEVAVIDAGSYSNNGNVGIYAQVGSVVQVNEGTSPILVSNNIGGGVKVDRSVFEASGISITNNKSVAGPPYASGLGFDEGGAMISGFGISEVGSSRAVINAWSNSTTISGNQGGGIFLGEGSEISLCCGAPMSPTGQPIIVQGNGPVGISVGLGSQLTMYDGVQVTNHTNVGVDVFGNSQAYFYGVNQISNNGTDLSDPARAGVRVDGNSEAYFSGGQVSQNGGPGLLALVNSSVDFSGVAFSANTGGSVLCDESSWMVSDLDGQGAVPYITPGGLQHCRTPNGLGRRAHAIPGFQIPDLSRFKALAARYQQLMSSLH